MVTAPPPSPDERYCAWYGHAGDGDVLYFGQAAFWSAMARAGGDPQADLLHEGPLLIGRFDLDGERLLAPLQVGPPGEAPRPRSGVWDVLTTADGAVYFTTFFEAAGRVDLASGAVRHLPGNGLNELAIGPAGTVLVTRYGSGADDAGDGELIALAADGTIARRWPLDGGSDHRLAPKTPAHDPHRDVLWLTADWLPRRDADAIRHDAIRLDATGRARVEPVPPELQFVATARDGTLYRALAWGSRLALQVLPPPGGAPARLVPLDDAFAAEVDFVQDIQPAPDGRVAVTRWSGRIDVLHPDGALRSVQLPRPDPAGLYYTAVLRGDRLCATYCADVTVVCAEAP